MKRRFVILTEGHTRPMEAKTAASMIRYRADEVVAILDTTRRGSTSGALLGVGGDLRVVGGLGDAPGADTLLIGIAPPGGQIPHEWREVILEALHRGMDVISGLHQFLADDPEFATVARQHGARLIDVRRNTEHDVANRKSLRPDCLRIQTVGNDCGVGKMTVAIEITRALERAGHDAKFVATGQTGILIEGDGCPVDGVVSDFISGAAEKLVLANQHHDLLLIEGQGSLAHPRYSAVTLGLLHGCLPHALVLCYEVGRREIRDMEPLPLTPLEELKPLYETMAALIQPCRVIAVAMNSANVSMQEADEERDRLAARLGVPVGDVFRHGTDEFVQAILAQRDALVHEKTAP